MGLLRSLRNKLHGQKKTFKFIMKTIYCPMGADLISYGHINILQTAKTYGKVIVGLFSDDILKLYFIN